MVNFIRPFNQEDIHTTYGNICFSISANSWSDILCYGRYIDMELWLNLIQVRLPLGHIISHF